MPRSFPRSPALLLCAGALVGVLLPVAFAQETSFTGDPSAVQLYATGLVGNSAIAVDSQGDLVVTNYRRPGTIGRISASLGAAVVWEMDRSEATDSAPPSLVGLALDDDQRVLALDSSRGTLWRWNPETNTSLALADRHEGRRFDALFAIAVDRSGNLYFSESECAGSQSPSGSIYQFQAATNRTARFAGQLDKPTGLCLSFEGNRLYFAESGAARIVVVDLETEPVDSAGRTLSLRSLLGLEGMEDVGRIGHLTTDRRGWLYVALWDRGEVAVIDPQKSALLEVIPSGGKTVFGLALRYDALLMSLPEKEAIYSYDLRPLISRHAP